MMKLAANFAVISAFAYFVLIMCPHPADSTGLDIPDRKTIEFHPVEITPSGLNFYTMEIEITGCYAIVASGSCGLNIFDISTPSKPQWVHHVDIPCVRSFEINGDYLYIPGCERDVLIVDISCPEAAAVVSRFPATEDPKSITVSGDVAYVQEKERLMLFDVSTPLSPIFIHSIQTGYITNPVIYNNFIYVRDTKQGLMVIDARTPGEARLVKTIEEFRNIRDMVVYGDYAYLLDNQTSPNQISITVLNLTDPASPETVGTFQLDGSINEMKIHNGNAYASVGEKGLYIIDLADPVKPVHHNTIDTPGSVECVTFYENYLVLGDAAGGLRILDISDPSDVEIIGLLETPVKANDIVLSNGYAIVANRGTGLDIIDVEPVEDARLVETYYCNVTGPMEIQSEDRIVIGSDTKLLFLDVSDPTTPIAIADIDLGIKPKQIRCQGDWVYALSVEKGLQIIDVSNPVAPAVICELKGPMVNPTDMDISDGNAYITDVDLNVNWREVNGKREPFRPSMLHIIDISNAANPKVVESVAFKDRQLYCLKCIGEYVLVSDTYNLLTIDVSPRSLTKIVQTTTLPFTICEIQTASDYAITIGFSGAVLLDIKQPEVPRIVSVIDTPFG